MALHRLFALGFILAIALLSAPLARATDPLPCPPSSRTVAVMGDSLADGIWATLRRGWHGCDTVRLLRLSEVSDGLAMTNGTRWANRLQTALDGNAADILIFQLGANDARRIRVDGQSLRYGTPEWQAEYRARIADFAERAQTLANQIFWVGLPVVGDVEQDGEYQYISGLIEAELACPRWRRCQGLRFVDVYEATQFGTGGFVRSTTIEGRARRLRAGDQIHFTDFGYDQVLLSFWSEIEAALIR